MKQKKTAADYAAIAVAPLLIFMMITSLANFLTLTLYRGGFPGRISWILMMFTMGVVGIARIAIERDRTYSLGYAGILGLAAFVAMLRFVDSPLFVALILGLIAYLADIIVRDCTLIDETVDASGEGLVDTGRLFVKKRIESNPSATPSATDQEGDGTGKKRRKAHQPGRTVLYLALAALPLFGLGQFFLRNDVDTWDRAQRLLAFYLFSSLSLLVTTSLLGLRRYLRQRDVDMPVDVSIAWMFGGLVMIAAVLLLAYLAPMPGRALATFELPIQFDSPGDTQASRFGWGREGADKANPDAPRTIDASEGKEELGQSYQKGAPQGDVGEGSRQQGPGGNQSGGKQQGSSSSKSSGASESQASSKQSPQGQSPQGQPSQGESSQGESSQGESSQGQSPQGQSPQGQPSQGESSPDPSSSGAPQSSETQNGAQSSQAEAASSSSENRGQPDQSKENAGDESESKQLEKSDKPTKAPSTTRSSGTSQPPSDPQSISNPIPMITGIVKLLVFCALAGVIIAFLWVHRELIRQWWESLLAKGRGVEEESTDEFFSAITNVPPRSFASFRNPIGRESDLRRVMVITFQAFEAWAREQGASRNKDETPTEFFRRAAQVAPQAAAPAGQVVDAYNRIVYGRGKPTQKDLQAAEQVWRVMQTP